MSRIAWPLLVVLAACGTPVEDSAATISISPEDTEQTEVTAELKLAKEDRSDTVDVMSWNVEWFGSVEDGPTDEALQQANVAKVLQQTAPDLVGLVEVVSEDAFATLMTKLPNHRGLLVTDPSVTQGRDFYWAKEQKVALVYHRRFTVESARVVLTETQSSFAGRPPLEVKLRFDEDGQPRTLVVLVAHFKAMANLDGYTRRTEAAIALKRLLDTEYARRWVLVVGDFNDDLDVSTYRRSATPFAPFLSDSGYRFTTDALTRANISTTLTFSSTIDHHLATNELADRFLEGSAKVVNVPAVFPDAKTTTSDHLPVLTRYDLR